MKRSPLKRNTPLKSGSSLSRSTPMKKASTPMRKVNKARLDKRTKAYRQYTQSSEWRGLRFVVLALRDWTCERCGHAPYGTTRPVSLDTLSRAPELHVHHKTYARFGHELPEDLEVLCDECHMQHHATSPLRPRGLRRVG